MAMPPRYRLLVQLAAFCALRVGELTELRRSDIDTQRGVIMVRRAVVLVNCRFVIRKPKSDAGVRDVAIRQALMATVWEHLLTYTAPGPDGLLFPSRNDPAEHLRQSSLTRVFYPARKAAGRPDLRFHDLRHTRGAGCADRSDAGGADGSARALDQPGGDALPARRRQPGCDHRPAAQRDDQPVSLAVLRCS